MSDWYTVVWCAQGPPGLVGVLHLTTKGGERDVFVCPYPRLKLR